MYRRMAAPAAEAVVAVPDVQMPCRHLGVDGIFRVHFAVGAHVIEGVALRKIAFVDRSEVIEGVIHGKEIHHALNAVLQKGVSGQYQLSVLDGAEDVLILEYADYGAFVRIRAAELVVEMTGRDFLQHMFFTSFFAFL